MQLFLFSLNALLMVLLPLLMGSWLSRRISLDWGLFVTGAATFVFSQLFHIPFNALVLGRLRPALQGSSLSALWQLLLMVLFLGLSSGFFEEMARFFTYRFWASKARRWEDGLSLGLGHGGIEAMLLGLLAGINGYVLFALNQGRMLSLIPPEQQGVVLAQVETLAALPVPFYLLGAVERLFALCLHLSLSVMVLQVFTRHRAYRWLLAAIGWHALANGLAVLLAAQFSVYAAEGALALVAVLSLLFIRWRRPRPDSEPSLPIQLPPTMATLGASQLKPESGPLTPDQLEESRYQS